jgi:abortive infection bacteriophage resistance protein
LLADPKSRHVFKPQASFQTAFKLYRFDRELRLFILKELEKIEVGIRSQMIYTLSHYKGAFWYTDETLFANKSKHSLTLAKLRKEYDRSDEEFIKAFKIKYSDPFPPSWMMLEITSFGTLSKLYDNLKPGKSKRAIAHYFGLDDRTFASWLHCVVYIRNVCAHHARLWNRVMSVKPQRPVNPLHIWLKDASINNNRTYYISSMMLYLLQSVDQKHRFVFRLKILIKNYPNVNVSAMGFPENWENEPLWELNGM